MYMNGPVKMSHSERLQICHEIASRLHEVCGEKIIAIGATAQFPEVQTALSQTLRCFAY
jgi:hypothetical protein